MATCTIRSRRTQKRGGATCSAAVSALGFGSAIAWVATSSVSCDGAAKPKLIDSCTVCRSSLFLCCDVLSHMRHPIIHLSILSVALQRGREPDIKVCQYCCLPLWRLIMWSSADLCVFCVKSWTRVKTALHWW